MAKKKTDTVAREPRIIDTILRWASFSWLLTFVASEYLGWGSYGWVFAAINTPIFFVVFPTVQYMKNMDQVVSHLKAQGIPCRRMKKALGPTDIWLCRDQGLIVIAHQALFANRIRSIRDKSLRRLADATADLSESVRISPEYITTISIEPGAGQAKEELVDATRLHVTFDLEDITDLIRNTPKVSPTIIEEAWQREK